MKKWGFVDKKETKMEKGRSGLKRKKRKEKKRKGKWSTLKGQIQLLRMYWLKRALCTVLLVYFVKTGNAL